MGRVGGERNRKPRVVHRTHRAVFCAADLYDPAGTLLASARCTQIVLARSG